MTTKIITVEATPPAESTGADYYKGAPLNAAEFDQNLVNLRAAVDRKASLSNPTFTGTVVLPATTSIGDVSATELQYLNSVTSNVQDQLNGKQATITTLATNKGGTGLTSFTSGGVVYASSTSALTTGSALTFDGSNFGIGTASPIGKLSIGTNASLDKGLVFESKRTTGTNRNWAIQIDQSAEGVFQIFPSTTQGGSTFTNAAMTLDSSGNLGLGVTPSAWNSNYRAIETSYGAFTGNVTGVETAILSNAYRHSDGSYRYKKNGVAGCCWVSPSSAAGIGFAIASSGLSGDAISWNTAMTLDSSGNLLVGQTAPSYPPTSVADIFAGGLLLNPSKRTAANSASAYWEAATGAFFRSTSSLRYKQNIQDYNKGLSEVLSLRPVSFNPKDGNKADRTFAGFIAEEVDAMGLTEFVEYDAENKPDAIGYSQITALLTKAIQEQQAMIASQSATIESLTERIAALEYTKQGE